MSSSQYDENFYRDAADEARRSARVVVPLLLEQLSVTSVADVGCGWGPWLAAFRDHGATTLLGIDQPLVDPARLQFPRRYFKAADLSRPIRLRRRFDLALSLEVAEHLPAASAPTLVASLCRISDAVLFSAAIPHQGGTQHVNEQWPAYWAELFGRHGYLPVDLLRRRLWQHPEVAWWYQQNLLLYASPALLRAQPKLARAQRETGPVPAALVHPQRYLEWVAWGLELSQRA